MKGQARIVQTLNDVLSGELTAANQYFLAAKIYRRQGYGCLSEKLYKESLEEMKHAERLIERILFLEGMPNLQKLDKVRIVKSVPAQLQADLELERHSVERLNDAIEVARKATDNGSADLLEDLLESAEAHVAWLETQLALLGELGEGQYLTQQIK
jgi:bacterioferritin